MSNQSQTGVNEYYAKQEAAGLCRALGHILRMDRPEDEPGTRAREELWQILDRTGSLKETVVLEVGEVDVATAYVSHLPSRYVPPETLQQEFDEEERIRESFRNAIQKYVLSDEHAVMRVREILGKVFYLAPEVIKDEKGFRDVVPTFSSLREPLTAYIGEQLSNDIDPDTNYSWARLNHPYHTAHSFRPFLPRLYKEWDDLHPRLGRSWKLQGINGQEYLIKPPKTLDELLLFANRPEDPYCVTDMNVNGIMLYLWAAHQHVHLLGVWKKEGRNIHPAGLIPLYLLDATRTSESTKGKNAKEKKERFLHAEGFLLSNEISTAVVRTARGDEPFNASLVTIVAAYAALLKTLPAPSFSPEFRFLATQQPFLTYQEALAVQAGTASFPNKAVTADAVDAKGRTRWSSSRLEDTEQDWKVRLVPDPVLLSYLQHHAGYRFDDIYLITKIFSDDPERVKTELFNQIGPVKGKIKLVRNYAFFPYHRRLTRLERNINRLGMPFHLFQVVQK